MDRIVPWKELCEIVEPVYPKVGNGRPPIGLERMLRIYFLQHWFNLSDPSLEESLYESVSMRHFAGIDLGEEAVPDETTVCKFRHLLEKHNLAGALFGCVQVPLARQRCADQHRHHCGRHDHQRAFFDEEREAAARPRDAPDQERKPVVLWDESARGRPAACSTCPTGWSLVR
jgi:IS5 family transposase